MGRSSGKGGSGSRGGSGKGKKDGGAQTSAMAGKPDSEVDGSARDAFLGCVELMRRCGGSAEPLESQDLIPEQPGFVLLVPGFVTEKECRYLAAVR